MYFDKQRERLRLERFDFDEVEGATRGRHGPLLPSNIRCIICGPSNCGKTNLMLGLLTSASGLRFENLYVYSKSLYQPKYRFLDRLMSSVPEIGYFPHSEADTICTPQDVAPNSIVLFDDVACDKQDVMKAYFSMGRHKNADSFYLVQTYTRVPKHLIRDNVNFIISFKQDELNLRHIYDDHVNTDMSWDRFKEMCGECWNRSGKYAYLVIDKERKLNEGRYRSGFDVFIRNV
jgi:hypothetical protein